MNEFQSKFFRIFHLPEQCSVDFQKKDKHHVDYVVAKHWPMSPLYRSVSLNSMINSSFLCRVVEHGVLSHDGTSDEKFSTVLMNKFGVNSPHLFYSSENTSLCVFLQSMKKKREILTECQTWLAFYLKRLNRESLTDCFKSTADQQELMTSSMIASQIFARLSD